MRRFARLSGVLLTIVGALELVCALVVWHWQDPSPPSTQHKLAQQFQHELARDPGPKVEPGESLAAVVLATNLAVLRWPRHEPLALQACHPRFSATHRYIAYGRLVAGDLRGDRPLTAGVLAFR